MDTQNTVTVRAAEPADYAAFRDIYAQPGVIHGTLQMPWPSEQLWQDRLNHPSAQRTMLVACVGERPVGNIGLMLEANPRRRHTASVGMGVHDAFAGRGIGTRLMDAALDIADNWLRLGRVELTVYADNDRAIRLYERSGFVVEGRYSGYAARAGELVDALAMARVREQRVTGTAETRPS